MISAIHQTLMTGSSCKRHSFNSSRSADNPTATLQIPYLLSLAGIVADYLPAFPFVEGPTIRIVDKMDQAFAILLSQGRSSAAPFASNENDHLVSITDRVRIRSVIETTRIIAVEASAKQIAICSIGTKSMIATLCM